MLSPARKIQMTPCVGKMTDSTLGHSITNKQINSSSKQHPTGYLLLPVSSRLQLMLLYSVWGSEKSMCNHIHTVFGRRHWGQSWNWDDPLSAERRSQIPSHNFLPQCPDSEPVWIALDRGDSFSINPINVTGEAFGAEIVFAWFDWVDVYFLSFTSFNGCCCMSPPVSQPLWRNTSVCPLTTERANVSNQSKLTAVIFLDLNVKHRLSC